MGKLVFSVTPAAKCHVGVADLGGNLRIARIEFCRALELSNGALPFTAAAVNRSSVAPAQGVTRLEFGHPVEFSQPTIVVTIAPVIKHSERQMRIRRSGSNC